MIVIASHVYQTKDGEIAGPVHSLEDYFKRYKKKFSTFHFPIYGRYPFKLNGEEFFSWISVFPYSRFLFEGIAVFFETIRIKKQFNETIDYIGIDPLNALWGILLKKLKIINKLIIFTPDYSSVRYKSHFANQIYHFIDRLTVSHSDYVWAVSKPICDLRKKMGMAKNRIFLVPNSPAIKRIKLKPINTKNIFGMVYVTPTLDKSELKILTQMLNNLKKSYPKISLDVISSQKPEEKIKNVKFIGLQPHDKLLELLTSYGIGLAFYTKKQNWDYFRDSMKIRDYLACGLPVIVYGDNYTIEEIEKNKCGVRLNELDIESLSYAIKKVFDGANYHIYRKNAIKLADEYDYDKMIRYSLSKARFR